MMTALLGTVAGVPPDFGPLVTLTALLIVAVERVLAAAERWRDRE